MTACQSSYPKFPGAQDTPDQTRALTSSGCPSASCRAAGKTSCVPHSLSLPLPPGFCRFGDRTPASRGLGKGGEELRNWEGGRAVSIRRKSLLPSKQPHRALQPPSGLCSFFLFTAPSRSSALTSTLYASGQCTAWGSGGPVLRGPRRPFWPRTASSK